MRKFAGYCEKAEFTYLFLSIGWLFFISNEENKKIPSENEDVGSHSSDDEQDVQRQIDVHVVWVKVQIGASIIVEYREHRSSQSTVQPHQVQTEAPSSQSDVYTVFHMQTNSEKSVHSDKNNKRIV